MPRSRYIDSLETRLSKLSMVKEEIHEQAFLYYNRCNRLTKKVIELEKELSKIKDNYGIGGDKG